jgi:macrodomain Ter protein organizer (MatP/YcbG family)
MPIKSKAQRRKFAELLVKGEISPETFEEWNRAAGDAELPERLHPKIPAKPKRKTKSKRAKAKTARATRKSRPGRKRG